MGSKKNYISIKILGSYLVLGSLFIGVGWFLYSQSKTFSETENAVFQESNAILKVSNLVSNIYKADHLARKTIQTNSNIDLENYRQKTASIRKEIDSLKWVLTSDYQVTLLDSVQVLLSKKMQNIKQLKAIKNQTNDKQAVKNAIRDLSKMEYSLRKLELEDFVKNPASLGAYQRSVLKKYVAYLNQNIPDDSTNTLSKKESDSILKTSKTVLNEVQRETEKKKKSLNIQENILLQNELSISEQLGKVVNTIENQIIQNSTQNYLKKEKALSKTNQIVSVAAIIGFLSTLFFVLLILNDVSKTQSYKKQLEKANVKTNWLLKNREQLMATVSHDLKTPLSTIIGYTELLDQSDLNSKQHHFTKNIKNASEYVAKLVSDLLDFTQLEAGKIVLEKSPFSLNNLLFEVTKNIQTIYEHKPIVLSIHLEEQLHNPIIGDAFRLRQILSNIIGNAYKFTSKGHIKIEAYCKEELQSFCISIEDSGIGIEEHQQQLIFEEFTQADKNIEKTYGGTCLGLTISKRLVAILGGQLHLKSQLGKGSIFTIELPLEFDIKQGQSQVFSSKSSQKLTLICIDDDPNMLQLTTEVLKQNNYNVLSFENPIEALEVLKTTPFDCIITDIQMPEMDGFLFLEKLKTTKEIPYENQPVFAVTGRTDLHLEVYKKAGFKEVIQKPFSPRSLIMILDSMISEALPPLVSDEIMRPNHSNAKYSLETLKAFLTDEEESLAPILNPFIETTHENIHLLEKAITDQNQSEIKRIAHRMNPMFKQIQAHTISQKLDELELNDFSMVELSQMWSPLKTEIIRVLNLLEKELG